MADLNRIKSNVATMAFKGATDTDIADYVSQEGVSEDEVKNYQPERNWSLSAATEYSKDLQKNPLGAVVNEGIIKPVKTFAGGFYKGSADIANTANIYSEKIAKALNIPQAKDSIFKYMRDNWSEFGDQLSSEGLSEGVMQKIYSGLGQSVPAVAKIMTLGKFGMPISGAIEGGAEGGVMGAVAGGLEGAAMGKVIHAIQPLAPIVKYPIAVAVGAATTPGSAEDKIAGGAVFSALSAGKGGTNKEFFESLKKPATQYVKEATDLYRRVLKPGKGDIKNIEIKQGKDIDDSFRLIAEEGLPITKSSDNKLDTTEAIDILKDRRSEIHDILNNQLKSDPRPIFSLENVRRQAFKELKDRFDGVEEGKKISTSDYEKSRQDIDELIDKEIKYRGTHITGAKLNDVKQGMWSEGYDMGRPTKYAASRQLGRIAKETIEKGYSNANIKELNALSGKYATAEQILKNSHGTVVERGKIGRYTSQGLGTLIGGKLLGAPGAALFGWVGGKISDVMVSPERLSNKASALAKKGGISGKSYTNVMENVIEQTPPIDTRPIEQQPIPQNREIDHIKRADDLLWQAQSRGTGKVLGRISGDNKKNLYESYKEITKKEISENEFDNMQLTEVEQDIKSAIRTPKDVTPTEGGKVAGGKLGLNDIKNSIRKK